MMKSTQCLVKYYEDLDDGLEILKVPEFGYSDCVLDNTDCMMIPILMDAINPDADGL